MRVYFINFLVLCCYCAAYEKEEVAIKAITSHLIIGDTQSASDEAKKALKSFPESEKIKKLLIKSYAEAGNDSEALKNWNAFAIDPTSHEHDLLESLAWGVLKKGEFSSQLSMRLMSLLGAFFTRDAKAISFFVEKLRSTNSHERALAVRLAAMYRDGPLKDEVRRMLPKERVWYVRLELIHAIGAMGILDLAPDLKEIVANTKSTIEEKGVAIESLLMLYNHVGDDELLELSKSSRAGLRNLAVEIAIHLDLADQIPKLIHLLHDSSPDVRISMLNYLGLLGLDYLQKNEEALESVLSMLEHPSGELAITAAWVVMPIYQARGLKVLEAHLQGTDDSLRYLAAGALSRSGKAGEELSLKMMNTTTDSYVKVNLALGLIGRRVQVQKACDSLYDFLNEKKELIMWEQGLNPLMRHVGPSRARHVPQIPNYPVVLDQLTRLNILNVLAVLRYEKSADAIKNFLHQSHWGISGTAAATLLQEGDSETMDCIATLLEDPNDLIRLQSALVLAGFGGDEKAREVLKDLFSKVDREKKTQILEALGQIGGDDTIPFLIEVFSEPFQTLRIVAASALIQCLYH